MKVKQWLGIPELKKYETFVCDWHYYLKEQQNKGVEKEWMMKLLKLFFVVPWNPEADFYEQFYRRLHMMQK
jgi:hypothetical protein